MSETLSTVASTSDSPTAARAFPKSRSHFAQLVPSTCRRFMGWSHRT
jgi:hypothetical protein